MAKSRSWHCRVVVLNSYNFPSPFSCSTTQPLHVNNKGPNSTWLVSTRLDAFDFFERVDRLARQSRTCRASRDERVERDECVEPCFSNMADDEEAVVLACTSLVVSYSRYITAECKVRNASNTGCPKNHANIVNKIHRTVTRTINYRY